jgi:hypothetical protein
MNGGSKERRDGTVPRLTGTRMARIGRIHADQKKTKEELAE